MTWWAFEAREAGRWSFRRAYLNGYGEDYTRHRVMRARWWARVFARMGL